MPDTLTLVLVILVVLALGLAAAALGLAAHLRTRVYALEQLQGLTTRRIRVLAEHLGLPVAPERRRHRGPKLPSGMVDRRRPLADAPVPEGLGGHPPIDLPTSDRLAGDEHRVAMQRGDGERFLPPVPPTRPRRMDNE